MGALLAVVGLLAWATGTRVEAKSAASAIGAVPDRLVEVDASRFKKLSQPPHLAGEDGRSHTWIRVGRTIRDRERLVDGEALVRPRLSGGVSASAALADVFFAGPHASKGTTAP
jgi:hypothetical protein